jgi:hypothetical protein
MSEYAPPHVEYLESVIADCDAPLSRQDLARQILMLGAPPPCFVLPCPATRRELIAAVMMTEARLKAAERPVRRWQCVGFRAITCRRRSVECGFSSSAFEHRFALGTALTTRQVFLHGGRTVLAVRMPRPDGPSNFGR